MISMDERLIKACDKFIDKLLENNISFIQTKSQLVEQALLKYFNDLEFKHEELTKGEEQHES